MACRFHLPATNNHSGELPVTGVTSVLEGVSLEQAQWLLILESLTGRVLPSFRYNQQDGLSFFSNLMEKAGGEPVAKAFLLDTFFNEDDHYYHQLPDLFALGLTKSINFLKYYYKESKLKIANRLLIMKILTRLLPPAETANFLIENPPAPPSTEKFWVHWVYAVTEAAETPEELQKCYQILAKLPKELEEMKSIFVGRLFDLQKEIGFDFFENQILRKKLSFADLSHSPDYYYTYTKDPRGRDAYYPYLTLTNLPARLSTLSTKGWLATCPFTLTGEVLAEYFQKFATRTKQLNQPLLSYLAAPQHAALRADLETYFLSPPLESKIPTTELFCDFLTSSPHPQKTLAAIENLLAEETTCSGVTREVFEAARATLLRQAGDAKPAQQLLIKIWQRLDYQTAEEKEPLLWFLARQPELPAIVQHKLKRPAAIPNFSSSKEQVNSFFTKLALTTQNYQLYHTGFQQPKTYDELEAEYFVLIAEQQPEFWALLTCEMFKEIAQKRGLAEGSLCRQFLHQEWNLSKNFSAPCRTLIKKILPLLIQQEPAENWTTDNFVLSLIAEQGDASLIAPLKKHLNTAEMNTYPPLSYPQKNIPLFEAFLALKTKIRRQK